MPFLKTLIVSVCRWPLRPTGVTHHSSLLLAKQSSRRSPWPASAAPPLITRCSDAAAGVTTGVTTGITAGITTSATVAGVTSTTTAALTTSAGATAARLRFQKCRNIADSISDARSVDALERAADVQPPFVLQRFHAAPADGGVHVLIDPRPRDRRHLRQIHKLGNAAHRHLALLPHLRVEPLGLGEEPKLLQDVSPTVALLCQNELNADLVHVRGVESVDEPNSTGVVLDIARFLQVVKIGRASCRQR